MRFQPFSVANTSLYGLIIFSFSLINGEPISNGILRRIQSNIVITDFATACEDAKLALKSFPSHQELNESAIKAFALAGDEKEMWDAWNHYSEVFPGVARTNYELHEIMAWGILNKASISPLPLVRLSALLGAFHSNDAKGTLLLKQFCHDKNSIIRFAAIKLISQMRDAQLCDEIMALFPVEKNWKVHLELIKAIGTMKIRQGHGALLKIIAHDQSTADEKAAAIAGVLALLESIDRQEILALTNSSRSGLRLLACQVVSHLRSDRDIDQMILLASDIHSEVRAAALYALGLTNNSSNHEIEKLARSRLKDPSDNVAIIAAWLLTKLDSKYCKEAFLPLINHPKRDIRLQAASALSSTGKYGLKLALELFNSNPKDAFFKMNLALGLIYQQKETLAACRALHEGLDLEQGKWMWNEDTPFRTLAPSSIGQEEDIPNAPEAFNQLARLEILNILAVMKHPGAESAIRTFLQQHRWGISGMAAALLLMEGDETSLEIIKGLLKDPDNRIQMQAALILSLWGGGEEAIKVLETGYPAADRETKEKILEGLGRIGSKDSIPFLIKQLQEPQQFLRVIAASSLIQCLYN